MEHFLIGTGIKDSGPQSDYKPIREKGVSTMIFLGRRLSDITETDLQSLINNEVQEGDSLEYKATMYGNGDEDKREMLKDIVSLANHRGGFLIIGLGEDGQGIPSVLNGIEADNHVERIRESCLHNIEKRIIGLDIQDVRLANGRMTIIVRVPESLSAPHMVTFRGLNQFWKRHGRQKQKMSLDEIRNAFERRVGSLTRIDSFLLMRKAERLGDIGNYTYMVISSVPAYFRDDVVLDLRNTGLRQLVFSPHETQRGPRRLARGNPYPTINGLRDENWSPYWSQPRGRDDYLEVFHNGYIEFGHMVAMPATADISFNCYTLAEYTISFTKLVENFYGTYLPLMPLIINFAVYNAKGMWLQGANVENANQVKWSTEHLELPKIYVDNLFEESKLLAKMINDRVWNAFHRESAIIFNADGNLRRSG